MCFEQCILLYLFSSCPFLSAAPCWFSCRDELFSNKINVNMSTIHEEVRNKKEKKLEEERNVYKSGRFGEKAVPKRLLRTRPDHRLFGYHVEKVRVCARFVYVWSLTLCARACVHVLVCYTACHCVSMRVSVGLDADVCALCVCGPPPAVCPYLSGCLRLISSGDLRHHPNVQHAHGSCHGSFYSLHAVLLVNVGFLSPVTVLWL